MVCWLFFGELIAADSQFKIETNLWFYVLQIVILTVNLTHNFMAFGFFLSKLLKNLVVVILLQIM